MIYKKLQKDLDLQAIAYLKGQADSDFEGLKSIVDDPISDTTDILLIHGVRSQRGDHFQKLINDLAFGLEFFQAPVKVDSACFHPSSKKASVIWYVYEKGEVDKKYLYFYNIYWSPITDPVKEQIYAVLDDIPNRTVLAEQVKKKFMIDVFADLALYLGNYKRAIQQPVDIVLDKMMEKPNSKKVMITGSFGSKIVFDVLIRRMKTVHLTQRLTKDVESMLNASDSTVTVSKKKLITTFLSNHHRKFSETRDSLIRENIDVDFLLSTIQQLKGSINKLTQKDWIKEFSDSIQYSNQLQQIKINTVQTYLTKIRGFFMLSNQLPFTSMMELSPTTSRDSFVNNIYQDMDFLLSEGVKGGRKSLKIVSFYDPNDMFGYRLPKPEHNDHLEIVNVEAHNTTPFYFNPDSLRSKYLSGVGENEKIMNAIKSNLRQGVAKQSIVVNIDQPSESAKSSPAIINHLLHGSGFQPLEDTISITLNAGRNKPDKIRNDTVRYKTNRGKGSIPIKFIKTNLLDKIKANVGEMILNSFAKRLEKLQVKKAYLPNELPTKDINFSGLETALKKSDTLHILTMHGMVSKSPEHFDDFILKLTQRLNFNQVPRRQKSRQITFDPSLKMVDPAQLKIIDFENSQKKILRFYVVYWSPLTKPPKDALKEIDARDNMKEKRSVLPEGVKNRLINDGFCDVTLSLRTFRPMIDHCLKEAFSALMSNDPYAEDLLKDNRSTDKNIFFVSGSLGSKLLFDYLSSALIENAKPQTRRSEQTNHISSQEKQIANRIIKRLETFFMLSNQLPLISIRDLKPGPLHQETNEININWEEHIYNNWEEKIPHQLHIVSFFDPNDILGFRLKEKKGDDYKLTVTNVPLNLAGGFDIDVKQLIKFTKKVDRVLRKAIPSDEDLSKKENKILRKKLLKNLNLSVTANIVPFIDKDHPRQTFVFDFLTAHEGGKKDKRVIDMISFGTDKVQKRMD